MQAISDIPGLDGQVREHMYAHVFANADREVGGVLVGRAASHGAVPLVTAIIPALSAGERRSTLTFTQDTWEHVHRALERDYPHDQIVGWYHSHPGFGIFLSEEDRFIHRNFFSGTSQIAVVVDPLEGSEGVFGWEHEQILKWYDGPTARPGLRVEQPRLDPRSIVPSPGVGPPPERRRLGPDDEPELAPASDGTLARLAGALLLGVLIGFVLWEAVLRDDGGDAPPSRPAQSVQDALPAPTAAGRPGGMAA